MKKTARGVLKGSVKLLLDFKFRSSIFSPLPFVYPPSTTVGHLIEAFGAPRGLHRVLIGDDNQGYRILSQSDVVLLLVSFVSLYEASARFMSRRTQKGYPIDYISFLFEHR